MFVLTNHFLIILVMSMVVGLSLSLCVGLMVCDLSFLYLNRIALTSPCLIIGLSFVYILGLNQISLLMLIMVSLCFLHAIYSCSSIDVCCLITCHLVCSIFLLFLCLVSSSLIYVVFILLFLDLLSVTQLCIIPGTSSFIGGWSYLIYQSFLTILCWLCVCFNIDSFICLFWFMKLGAGFTGIYLPVLYRCFSSSTGLFNYIGSVNLLQCWCSSFLLFGSMRNVISVELGLLLLFTVLFVIIYWSFSMDFFAQIYLYGLCLSSVLVYSSCCFILLTGVQGIFSLTILGGFLLMSQCSWCLLVCSSL